MAKINVDDFDNLTGDSAEWLATMEKQLVALVHERARERGTVSHFGPSMARELALACIVKGYVPVCERKE